jgi:L-malate glycosyltransferase
MYKVLIIQAEMKQYRVPFFKGLHTALDRDGIKLTVVYSNSNRSHGLRGDRADLPRPIGQKVNGRWFFDRLLYQPVWKEIIQSDLVIVGPEIKYLINPILLLMSRLRMKTVAFWGLGPNRFPDRSRLAETVKRRLFTRVDWWFAYTGSVAEYLRNEGMTPYRITNVQNATDSAELIRLIEGIGEGEAKEAKLRLTGAANTRIGFYCGTMGKIKAIPFLLDTARLVKQRCPEFHLVLIGDGPERRSLEKAIAGEAWIHYLGSKYGRESALCYKMADVFLLAGTAGLAITDSLAAGLPVLATDLPTHPPEMEYIVDGQNGRVAPHQAEAFAASIAGVLSDEVLFEKLRQGAREAAPQYTMEAMVENFRIGIKRCLACGNAAKARGRAADLTAPRAHN